MEAFSIIAALLFDGLGSNTGELKCYNKTPNKTPSTAQTAHSGNKTAYLVAAPTQAAAHNSTNTKTTTGDLTT